MEPFRVEFMAAFDSKHQGDVECLASHQDRLYSGADDGIIKVWSQKDLSFLGQLQAHDSMIYALSAIGDTLYSASNDGAIKTWQLPSLEPGPTLAYHSEAVRKIKAMPSGDVVSADEGGFLQIWSGAEAKQAYEPVGEEIWDIAVDAEGLVYTSRDREIVVWLLKERTTFAQAKATLVGRAPICLVNDVFYYTCRDGMTIEACGGVARKFDKVAVLKGHDRIVNCMTHTRTHFFSAGWDTHVRVWDLQTHKCYATVECDAYLNAMAPADDGSAVFAGGADGLLVKITPARK